jgi:hypothetical protein
MREKEKKSMNECEDRIAKMEGGINALTEPKILEFEIGWPEAEIGGLRFNRQATKSVFEYGEDGSFYSRDILFVSARNTEDDASRDLLSKYLGSKAVRTAFIEGLKEYPYYSDKKDRVKIFLPKTNRGRKTYNGGDCGYWLKLRADDMVFRYVNAIGHTSAGPACCAGGCAPAFRIGPKEGAND